MLAPDAVQMAIDAYHAAPRKGKTEAITRCAALLGVHPATLRRALRSAGVVLGSSRKRHGNERYREWTRVIVGIACKTPAGAPPVPMWMALKQAVASGLVPAEAADVPLGTYYRISKELGYEVMLSDAWYREHMPRYQAAFEDKTITIPKDADILDDMMSVKLVKGVAKVVDRASGRGDDRGMRHGDSAIALALAIHASASAAGGWDWQPVTTTYRASRITRGY